jgi:RimJ/RimL family protein N-acetyltransferase
VPESPWSLKVATAEDRLVLRDIFVSSRWDHASVADRHPDSARAFLEAEFESRELSYRADFPGLECFLICQGLAPLGRLYLQRQLGRVFLVDFVILPEWQGRGMGQEILGQIVAEATWTQCVVQLHVEKGNTRAHRLYARFGFRHIGETAGTHWLLEKSL